MPEPSAVLISLFMARIRRNDAVDKAERVKNRTKAKVGSKVEWPLRILKRVFGFTKVRYRGLKKITSGC